MLNFLYLLNKYDPFGRFIEWHVDPFIRNVYSKIFLQNLRQGIFVASNLNGFTAHLSSSSYSCHALQIRKNQEKSTNVSGWSTALSFPLRSGLGPVVTDGESGKIVFDFLSFFLFLLSFLLDLSPERCGFPKAAA